jgi:quercetin dioxygenase-like cupin family protein
MCQDDEKIGVPITFPGSGTTATILQCVVPPALPPQGASIKNMLIELAPGDPGIPPHFHPGPITGYVLEGEVIFEVEGTPERVIKAGESFFEPGGDVIHYQGGNNLKDKSSKFLVVMICPPGKPVLTFCTPEELEAHKPRRSPAVFRKE